MTNSQNNNNPKKNINVEQWVKESDLPVSWNPNNNNHKYTADWLEKQSWEILNDLKFTGGMASAAAIDVTEIFEMDWTPRDYKCGFVTAGEDINKIHISSSCNVQSSTGNSHRMNENNRLYKSIKHETRHTWQNRQLLLMPDGVTGSPPANDSDNDYCPEIVADGTGGGPNDSSPIQDGKLPTTGDNQPDDEIYDEASPYPWAINARVGKCLFLLESDAVEFENE